VTIDFPSDDRERELRLIIARAAYERHVSNEVGALVERTLNELLDVMTSRQFRDLTIAQRQRLQALYAELDRVIRAGYTAISAELAKRMEAYAQLESDVARATVSAILQAGGSAVTVSFYRLPNAYLAAIAKLPIDGLKIGDWFQAQSAQMSVRVKQTIQKGMLEGKGPAEITRRILAPERVAAKAGEAPPLSKRAVADAKTVTRTTVNAVQNDATRQSYRQLPASVSDSYMWMSVHDARTSKICIGLDGKVWKYEDPAGRIPPAHPNCRSTTRALIRGVDVTLADQKQPATMRGYESWLKTQPESVQNEILGPSRAGFWRDGKMTLADLIDQDNRVLTLKQLRTKLGLDAVPTT
jgi:SPP1 gp7 family putative phage head morphogenesis protein